MTQKSVLIVGAGKRVLETALPALQQLPEHFRLEGLFARSERTIEACGAEYRIERLDDLEQDRLRAADLLYLVVGKQSLPRVLKQLAAKKPEQTELLIETPVLLFKHLHHLKHLDSFRQVCVAEDCIELPWVEPARALFQSGALGELQEIVFQQSAYAYHGVATAKALLGAQHVLRARRQPFAEKLRRRTLRFERGLTATILEPRDYAIGHIHMRGDRGSISDIPRNQQDTRVLTPLLENDECVGIRLGDVDHRLPANEAALLRGDPPQASVIARQDAMKRVGFLRLLMRIHAGKPGYSVSEGLDDMLVDYALEKAGFYMANPLVNMHTRAGRFLPSAAMRVLGRG